jgi:hypothetical protein
MSKITIFVSLALILCVVSGCVRRVSDFTVMSTKNINCQHVDITKLDQHHGVEGKDICLFGWGTNIQNAVDKALAQYDGNLLIDAVVYYETNPFIPLEGYTVKGTVVTVPYQQDAK